MCRVVIYANPDCGCRWLQIYQQCRPNAGFSQCDDLGKGRVDYASPDERESLQCPVHDLRGWYDLNYVRKSLLLSSSFPTGAHHSDTRNAGMIVKETNGFRVGSGPSKKHPGFDVKCVVM